MAAESIIVDKILTVFFTNFHGDTVVKNSITYLQFPDPMQNAQKSVLQATVVKNSHFRDYYY